jgi:hypothetical protein
MQLATRNVLNIFQRKINVYLIGCEQMLIHTTFHVKTGVFLMEKFGKILQVHTYVVTRSAINI